MRAKLLDFLQIPPSIRPEFLQDSVKKNDISLFVICLIIAVTELYNIARVVLWSPSGLRTLNNRIYFGMYCTLLAVVGFWMLIRKCLRKTSFPKQWTAQYTVILLIFLWNLCLNAYDLHRNANAGVTVFTTALLGLSAFIQMSSIFSLICFGSGYLLFQLLVASHMSSGQELNLTITFAVALLVSLTRAHHASVSLQQQQQINQINIKLQELAKTDPLTGLLNKITLECHADQYLQYASRKGFTLFIVDLDDFKSVNDQYGHPCGDRVLVETADSLRLVFSQSAGIGRIGGDEFAVIFTQSLEQEAALALGAQIIKELSDIRWDGQSIGVCCSVGVCTCTSCVSYDTIYTETDRMLYQAKRSGKGRCCFHLLGSDDLVVAQDADTCSVR
ncbi:MAG: GGDEF domain-containing protein [Butyricicoccus sp.]|nr:GGDEF domain-containing protein [Butyricicoccus sp.]